MFVFCAVAILFYSLKKNVMKDSLTVVAVHGASQVK